MLCTWSNVEHVICSTLVVLPPSSVLDLIIIDVATENTVQTNLLLKRHFTLILVNQITMVSMTAHLFLLTQPVMQIPLEERNPFWQLKLNTFFPTGLNEREVSLDFGSKAAVFLSDLYFYVKL